MQRWTDLGQVPEDFGPSVVTIGTFDGVHRGHAAVLGRMVADARAAGARSVALTFSPHPAAVHRPDNAPVALTGDEERLDLLAATGLDAVLLVTYTLEWARQTPEDFVRTYLLDGLRAQTVVVGRDVQFGWQNSGDLTTMIELGERLGFEVDVVPDVQPEGAGALGAGRRWSSTWARELLERGDVAAAAHVLGRRHAVRGVVVHGDARGRELGFPTANLGGAMSGMVPADGVYAGRLLRVGLPAGAPDRDLPAAVSIGTNPTFDGAERRVEAHVLDRFDLDLYDEEVAVELVEQLRPTVRFESAQALVAQMNLDVARARDLLADDVHADQA